MIKNPFNSTKIIFGEGHRVKIKKIIKKKNLLIVCSERGKKEILNDKKFDFLKNNKISWIDSVKPNPSIKFINSCIKKYDKKKFDFIIGIGGGSSIDTAKAIKLFFSLKKKYSMLYVIKNIKKLKKNTFIKLIAIPTTSGTGSEVTPYSTVWDDIKKKKYSLNDNFLLPEYAVIDPELTYSLGIEQTINTGLDAFNQSFESIWNKNATSQTIKYASESIGLGLRGLKRLSKNIKDEKSRQKMSKSSLYSGMCISKTKTCICHSLSYPLTAHYGVPHGLACAFTMLEVIKYLYSKDKTYFNDLLKNAHYKSFKIFFRDIEKLFKTLNVKKKIKSYKINYKKILHLMPEMYTPERADNFPYKINELFIKNLLKKSLT